MLVLDIARDSVLSMLFKRAALPMAHPPSRLREIARSDNDTYQSPSNGKDELDASSNRRTLQPTKKYQASPNLRPPRFTRGHHTS